MMGLLLVLSVEFLQLVIKLDGKTQKFVKTGLLGTGPLSAS